jgi:hypothetical protein
MLTFNIGKPPGISIKEQQDGMQIYKNMTMKSNMYLEKLIYQQMYYHNHQE